MECRLANQVWQSCGDGESYVRAAALSGLGRVAGLPRLWESLLETCKQVQSSTVILGSYLSQYRIRHCDNSGRK